MGSNRYAEQECTVNWKPQLAHVTRSKATDPTLVVSFCFFGRSTSSPVQSLVGGRSQSKPPAQLVGPPTILRFKSRLGISQIMWQGLQRMLLSPNLIRWRRGDTSSIAIEARQTGPIPVVKQLTHQCVKFVPVSLPDIGPVHAQVVGHRHAV